MLQYLALGPLPGLSIDASRIVYLHGTDPRTGGGAAPDGVALTRLPVGVVGVAAPRQSVSPYVARSGSVIRTRFSDGKRVALEGEVWGTSQADLMAKLTPILAMFARTPGAQFAKPYWPVPNAGASAPILLQWQRAGGGPHLSQEVYLVGEVAPEFDPFAPRATFRADLVSPDRFALRRSDASAGYTAPSFPAVTVGTGVGGIASSAAVTVGGEAPARVKLAVAIPASPSGTQDSPHFRASLEGSGGNAAAYTFAKFASLAVTPTAKFGTYTYDLHERVASVVGTNPHAYPLGLLAETNWHDLPPGTYVARAATTSPAEELAGVTITYSYVEAYL